MFDSIIAEANLGAKALAIQFGCHALLIRRVVLGQASISRDTNRQIRETPAAAAIRRLWAEYDHIFHQYDRLRDAFIRKFLRKTPELDRDTLISEANFATHQAIMNYTDIALSAFANYLNIAIRRQLAAYRERFIRERERFPRADDDVLELLAPYDDCDDTDLQRVVKTTKMNRFQREVFLAYVEGVPLARVARKHGKSRMGAVFALRSAQKKIQRNLRSLS